MTVETPRARETAEALLPGVGRDLRRLWRRYGFLARERLGAWVALENGTGALWRPVAIGAGAGAYFGLRAEPAFWMAPVLLALLTAFAWGAPLRLAGPIRYAAALLSFAALGFIAADFRTDYVGAPTLTRDIGIVDVAGRLVAIEEGPTARRLIIAPTDIQRVDESAMPQRIRVNWRGKEFNAAPGDMVRLRAGLSPPPPPAAPGAFDFARNLYFQRIGAVGFAVSAPVVIDDGNAGSLSAHAAQHIETMRVNLARRIMTAAPGEGGAILAAIVTGKRAAIPPSAQAALRDAGLAHLLAISGLHMGLATGIVFFCVRFGLALIEPAALKHPIKKWAAMAALAAGGFYLLLSGGGWSARRAFLMAAIAFFAILVDRRALSLRNVAIAAAIILLTTPEAIFHPGFQMSFAAVTALIAIYEWLRSRPREASDFSTGARFRRYAAALAITDVVSTLATAPFALYHFNRVAVYSLPANLISMPIMAFWIMPMAVTALLLAPFGLDGFAWRIAASGLDAVLVTARTVTAWPGATSMTPQWPLSAMAFLAVGGLWLCLARAPWRLAGLIGLPAAAVAALTVSPPHVFVAASGRNAAIIDPDSNEFVVYSRRRDRFSAKVWKETIGLDPAKTETISIEAVGRCDEAGCIAPLQIGEGAPLRLSFLSSPMALAEDCARADLVVAFFPVSGADWRACNALLIDRRSIWRDGAHSLRYEDGHWRIKTVSEARGARPWTE
ncbi:MAG: ComEC/Rec2 family competence protein [Pseudomonadota bacterium]